MIKPLPPAGHTIMLTQDRYMYIIYFEKCVQEYCGVLFRQITYTDISRIFCEVLHQLLNKPTKLTNNERSIIYFNNEA